MSQTNEKNLGELDLNKEEFNHEVNEVAHAPLPNTQIDGGYGWLVVLASFLMQACSFGVAAGFGVFVDYYSSVAFPSSKYAQVSLIGTVAPTTIAFASMFTGRLCDIIGTRKCAFFGTIIITLSYVIGSFSTDVWHLIVTQGFMFGLGGALIYVPANTVVAHWFTKYRGLAFGIGTAGSGIGGLVFSLMNSYLLESVGYQWTLRYNAVLFLGCLGFSAFVIKMPNLNKTDLEEQIVSRPQSKPFNIKLVLNSRFILFGFSTIFASFGYLVPLYYLPSFAMSKGLTSQQGATLVAIVNGSSALGRIILGLVGDKLGHLNVYLLCLICSTITLVIWRFSTSFAVLAVFSVLYGMPAGGFAGGFPAACAALFGLENLATIMGLAYAPTGVGDLAGPPLGGFILDLTQNYEFLIYYAIALYFLGSFFMFLVKVVVVDQFFRRRGRVIGKE